MATCVIEQADFFNSRFAERVRARIQDVKPPQHAERALHMHSLNAYTEGQDELGARARTIRDWLRKFGPATDRQVKDALFGEHADMNMVRPRITDLVNARQAHEVGEVMDTITGRHVRMVRATMQGKIA